MEEPELEAALQPVTVALLKTVTAALLLLITVRLQLWVTAVEPESAVHFLATAAL